MWESELVSDGKSRPYNVFWDKRMNILVCVKRVPVPGAKIVLTEDEQAINTKNLGFTISPHEECAVEEAIRIVAAQGGSSTVLTLGEATAIEQLRGAMAMGIDNGILIATDGREFGTRATAKAIVEAIEKQRAEATEFDVLLFGNESADSGGYQVGIRVAHALDLPCITGVKSLEFEGHTAIAKREGMNGTMEVFEIELPAVFTIKEGINVPRYPTMPGRMRAKRANIPQYEAQWFVEGLDKLRLKNPPESGKQVQILGHGTEATDKVVALLKELKILDNE